MASRRRRASSAWPLAKLAVLTRPTLLRWPAVVALACIAGRHARGMGQSPGGLLRRMVELHETGTLRLDRTLFGLADELTQSRATQAASGTTASNQLPTNASTVNGLESK